MTFYEFMEDIEVSLGGNLVSVELEEKDYRVAFKRAVRKFKQYGSNNYMHNFLKVEVVKDQTEITLPPETDTVVKIIRPDYSSDFFSSEDLFVRKAIDELFTVRGRTSSCGSYNFIQYEFMQQEQERLKRFAATDVDFNHNRFDHTLSIYNKPRRDETWFIEAYQNLTDEEYMQTDWVAEWTKAECLEILGRAYSKFSSLASPTGETSLDGRSMIQEATEIKRQLMEDAQNGMSGAGGFYQIVVG